MITQTTFVLPPHSKAMFSMNFFECGICGNTFVFGDTKDPAFDARSLPSPNSPPKFCPFCGRPAGQKVAS